MTPLWRLGAVASGAAGIALLAGGGSLALAILLLIAALAAAGVILGGGAHGPAVEGHLDLSARLGLGLLGGLLGAVVSAGARAIVAELGAVGASVMGLSAGWTGAEFLAHLGSGAVWGLMLGVLYPQLPGSPGSRGAIFAIAPTLYVVVTLALGETAFALHVGRAVFGVFSILGVNVLWGATAGVTLGWGEAGEETPVARPIDQ